MLTKRVKNFLPLKTFKFILFNCTLLILILCFLNLTSTIFKEIEIFHENISENEMEFNFDYKTLFNKTNLNISRFPSIPFISGSSFKGLADILVNDLHWKAHKFKFWVNPNFKPELVECGQIIYVKSNTIEDYFVNIHPKIPAPYILLTHNSDDAAGPAHLLKYLNESKLLMWFGQNVVSKHPKLRPIPIGIANEMWPHGNIAKLNNLSRKLKPFNKRKFVLYLNFKLETNKKSRTDTINHFKKHFGNDSTVFFANKKYSWEDYLKQLGDSQFVISPPGNGIDCHRTWEALAMGAVPIVLNSELQPLYNDMPVLVVNDWSEVTMETLTRFKSLKLNLSADGIPWRQKIWMRYWINEFHDIKTKFKELCSNKKFI